MTTIPSGRPCRPREHPRDPRGPCLAGLAASPSGPGLAEDPQHSPILDLLAEGGFKPEAVDRLRLLLRFERRKVVAVLLGVHPDQVSRLYKQFLARARRILLAAALREALGQAECVALDLSTGASCANLRPDELIATDEPRAAPIDLVRLARAVRRIEREDRAGGTHLCGVRQVGGCRLWPARLPAGDWILPFAAVPESIDPIILPLRRAA